MTNTAPPRLETARLELRLMKVEDVDALLTIFADPRVMAAFDEPAFDRAQMLRWVERNLGHQARHGYGLFSVICKADGLLIGDCGLEWTEVDGAQVAELGYDFRSAYWNQGYATEAARAVAGFAFRDLGLSRLVSLIRVGNAPSRRVAEKIGMRAVGEITRYGRLYGCYQLDREPKAPESDWQGPAPRPGR